MGVSPFVHLLIYVFGHVWVWLVGWLAGCVGIVGGFALAPSDNAP